MVAAVLPSLLLNDLELFGTTTNPEYHVAKASGETWDLSEAVPIIAVITGTFLDGDQVTGSRSGNRSPVLPIRVTGTSQLDLETKVNRLLVIVNSPLFTFTYTPPNGLPVVVDCYRGSWRRSRVVLEEQGLSTLVTLKFQASPFGRSNALEQITVAAALLVDGFNNGTGLTGATYQTGTKYEGTGAAQVTLNRQAGIGTGYYWYNNSTPVSRAVGPLNLSTYASLGVRFRWAAPTGQSWNVQLQLNLSDGTHSGSLATPLIIPAGSTAWYLYSFSLADFTAANPLVNLAAITSYQIYVTTSQNYFASAPGATATAFIDDLRAYPSASTSLSTTHGSVLTLPAVKGTARAPLSLTVTQGGGGMTSLLIHRPPVGQDPDAAILAALSGSPPAATVAGPNNTFRGTYTVVLLATAQGSGSRTVNVKVEHKQGATVLATVNITTPAYTTNPTAPYLLVDDVTLPLMDVPDENVTDTLVFTVTSVGGTADTFTDIALCDTRGQFLAVTALPAGTTVVYIDDPEPPVDLGQVYASATDRTAASSVRGNVRDSGGTLFVEPGDDKILVASPDGVPTLTATYPPCWLDGRTV